MKTFPSIFTSSILSVVMAGCVGAPRPMPGVPASEKQAPAPAGEPKPVDKMDARLEAFDPASALAQKSAAYAREMAPLLAMRGGLAPVPSEVEWGDSPLISLNHLSPTLEDYLASPHKALKTPADTTPVESATPAGANTPAQASPAVAMGQAQLASDRVEGDRSPREVAMAAPVNPQPLAVRTSAANSDALYDRLSKRIRDNPRDVAAHLEYQLLSFLRDEPTPELSSLATLPTEDRELVTAILDGLGNFRNGVRADGNMLLSRKIKPLLDVSDRLRSQADLTIPTIALCTKVDGFGKYDPIDPARFPVGKDTPLIVYCEVANFASNLNDAKLWQTQLTWDMTLYAEQGMSVWSSKTDTISDSARVRRHDFFALKKFTVPSSLPIGRYLLKVSIVDTQANRVSEATVPIVIGAQ
jgi:hypothetical protein